MGAINYGTSDFITIGYNCDWIDYDDDNYNEYVHDDFCQVEYMLKKFTFEHFKITVESGYYEGFYINISLETLEFWNSEEKRDAQKEITRLKKFLIDCVNTVGLVAVRPGWCTRYETREETLKSIPAAVSEMRQTVKEAPTEYTRRCSKS